MISMPAVSMTPAPPTGATGEEAVRSGDVMSTPGEQGRWAPAGGGAGLPSSLPRWPGQGWPAEPGPYPGSVRPVPAASSRIRALTARLLIIGLRRVDHLPAIRVSIALT